MTLIILQMQTWFSMLYMCRLDIQCVKSWNHEFQFLQVVITENTTQMNLLLLVFVNKQY